MINIKEFIKLKDVLYRRTGISIDEKKFNTLERKLNELMKKQGYESFRSFFHDIRFNKSQDLFQELINVVTVNETYFYRENYQFESLVEHALQHIHDTKPKGEPVRILCAPSSTGEEPYSIALHLLNEANLVEERDFEIVGIDIDSKVIDKAKAGLFSKRSIQFVPTKLLKEYFVAEGTSYRIVDFLRDAIDFKIVNIFDKLQLKRLGRFDVIFSRNMLIYFDDSSRKEVAMSFYEMLVPKGYVFLGHAESMNRIVSVFSTVKLGNSIVYQKKG
jgi:chemotaxis protein methyltransferase CheR